MTKVKVLGEAYGIQITRPWSKEMYDHNNKVREVISNAIIAATKKAYKDDDLKSLVIIGTAVNGYTYANGDCYRIKQDILNNISTTPNHWLHSETWPDLVKAKLVKDIDVKMIGY